MIRWVILDTCSVKIKLESTGLVTNITLQKTYRETIKNIKNTMDEITKTINTFLHQEDVEAKYAVKFSASGIITLRPRGTSTQAATTKSHEPPVIGDDELWKELCLGYEVSNYGRLKTPNSPDPHYSDNINFRGTPSVSVRGKQYTVIKLVAELFMNMPEDCRAMYLSSANKMDTRITNIRWSTNRSVVRRTQAQATVDHEKYVNYENETWRRGPYFAEAFFIPATLWISSYGRIKKDQDGKPYYSERLDTSGAPVIIMNSDGYVRVMRLVAALHVPKPYIECKRAKYINPDNKLDCSVGNIEWSIPQIATMNEQIQFMEDERKMKEAKKDKFNFVPEDD